MKLLLYLLLLFALHILYSLFRFVFKRARLLHQVKCFAKEHSIECIVTTPAFLLPSNRYGTVLLLKTEKATYNIRLFGLLRKNCAVHFWSKEQYSAEKYIPRMSLMESSIGHRPVRRKMLGKWDTNSDTEILIFLYSSANGPIRITKTQINRIERIEAGAIIDDVLLADTDFLFRFIKKRL